ncbi:hypothetical protein HKX48_004207 [Thoreauomyces humboldtii]|nr:hypothetical protein HKX48_004207 [Thoreauomyces humboldtii]
MSPELISESAYNAKSDIWALGLPCYSMNVGRAQISFSSIRGYDSACISTTPLLPVVEQPPIVDPAEELRQRLAELERGEAALLAREEEWRTTMATREDRFHASIAQQEEALIKKYSQMEQNLLHVVRGKDQELKRKDEELAEIRALLQQGIAKLDIRTYG